MLGNKDEIFCGCVEEERGSLQADSEWDLWRDEVEGLGVMMYGANSESFVIGGNFCGLLGIWYLYCEMSRSGKGFWVVDLGNSSE